MKTIKISPKFQVVIPKEIRQKMQLKPGQLIQLIQLEDRIEFIPVQDIKKFRGALKGINTEIKREGDRI